MNLIQTQEQFIAALLDSILEPWDKIEVHYENYIWDNKLSEIYVAHRFFNGEKFDIDLSLEAFDTLDVLQQQIPDGQNEHWTWFIFLINSEGQYIFEYKYGVPPLIAVEIAANQ